MAPLTLGYWNVRGYAQPIRLLLEHAGAEYEDIRYNVGPPPDYDRKEWLDVKFTLGLDFPNNPYIIDGDVRLTQSIAVLRYVGRKFGLAPKTEAEQVRADLVEQQILDWRSKQSQTFYNPDYDNLKAAYLEGLKENVQALSKFLGDRDWLVGSNLTYVDFLAYEWLDVNRLFSPGLLDSVPNLQKYVERLEALPNVSKYMKSSKFLKWPINGPMAKWGGASMPSPI